MIRQVVAIAVLLLLWAFPAAAVPDCMQLARDGSANVEVIRDKSEKLKYLKDRDRVADLLADAEKLLEKARVNCREKSTFLDRSTGVAQIVAAQGLIAAAGVVVKTND